MTKKRSSKRALLMSILSILTCMTMLIGSTFAWFTDSVTSSGNIIKSGTLDVTMEWKDATSTGKQLTYKDASEGAIFNYDKWEPGYVEAKNIKISNVGTLALKYQLNILANGAVSELSDVIDVYYAEKEITLTNREMTELTRVGTLTEVLAGMPANMSGDLLKDESDIVTIALKMQESATNEYQDLAIGSDFSVQLMATQLTAESDSFDNQYDKESEYDKLTMLATKEGEKAVALSFEDFCKNVNAGNDYSGWTITLTEDIDFGGAEWTPIGLAVGQDLTAEGSVPFSGIFDGNGHTLSNFKVTNGVMVNGDPWLSLFTAIYAKDGNTAGVKNLTLSNVTYDNPNGTIGAIVNVADSDGASALEFSNINISGTIRGFGRYGDAGIATLMFGNEVTVSDVDLNIDFIIPADFTVSTYKFISPCIGQISLGDNGHITLADVDWSDCNYYYPSTFRLEDRSTVIANYNSIWVYNTPAGTRVLGCGGYSGQFYDNGVTYTINGVDYTHADLLKGQKDVPGYMYDYIIRPTEFTSYEVTSVDTAEELSAALTNGGEIYLNGTIDLGGQAGNTLNVANNATIKGGTIKGTGWTGELNYAVNATSGNIVFDGVTFDTTDWSTVGWANWGISANINGTANVTFKNCTFKGTQCPIYQSGANAVVTLENCTFTGGYIQCEIYSGDFALGQDLIVKNCDFTGMADVLHIYDHDKDPSSEAIAEYLTANGNTFTGTCKQTCN